MAGYNHTNGEVTPASTATVTAWAALLPETRKWTPKLAGAEAVNAASADTHWHEASLSGSEEEAT